MKIEYVSNPYQFNPVEVKLRMENEDDLELLYAFLMLDRFLRQGGAQYANLVAALGDKVLDGEWTTSDTISTLRAEVEKDSAFEDNQNA
jgi:hypothetical protein